MLISGCISVSAGTCTQHETVLKAGVILLTRWEPPQGALDIQQHLVVVLVILPLYLFWTGHVTIGITTHKSNTVYGPTLLILVMYCVKRKVCVRNIDRAYTALCIRSYNDTWLLIQDVKGDVEEPWPDLTAYLISQQSSLADSHPPQSRHIHWTHTQGLRDLHNFPLPSGVPV